MLKFLKIILLSCVLVGCGFHLRGQTTLPPQLKVLYLQTDTPYSDFSKQLRAFLHTSAVQVTDSAATAPFTLQILSAHQEQQLTGSGASGQTNTYLLHYTVQYQLLNNQAKVVQAIQTVSASRSYAVTSNQVLGDTNLQNTLVQQMQREVIYQIMNRLQTPQTQRALIAARA